MRVLFLGGTGPVGHATVPLLVAGGHELALAHSGRHQPPEPERIEQLLGERSELLAADGPVERWAPEVVIDTFAGGATAAKAAELGRIAERTGLQQLIAISSIDVYRQAAEAGIDDHEVVELARGPIPIREDAPKREPHSTEAGAAHDNLLMEAALEGAPRVTILRPGAIYGSHPHPRVAREWFLVSKVAAGDRRLELPLGGTQLFHRVALDTCWRRDHRRDRASSSRMLGVQRLRPEAAHLRGARARSRGCARLGSGSSEPVEWQPDNDHPWGVRHPVVADTARLEQVLGVLEPDPHSATVAQIEWLWANRESLRELDLA